MKQTNLSIGNQRVHYKTAGVLLIHASEPAELGDSREKGIRSLKEKVSDAEVHQKKGGHNLHWDDPVGIGDMVKNFTGSIEDRYVPRETKE
ncbi:hypothetical protein [Bacillus sp. Marseille-Q1617]|uniref:hypothetical protein n=1 Tax=Bacillus sp. Marseille-Q1617 TaxID=2736887 RepID=UPI00158C1F3E|nr:hypothetical protein [Bacillus sp. Marseille-Q1617]